MPDAVRSGSGCIALLVGPSLWTSVDHGIEIAWRLAKDHPDRPLRWLAAEDDHWLSSHDLRHAGLADRVLVVDPGEDDALRDVAVLVRTGYSTAAVPTLIAGHAAGLKVAALRSDDLPFTPTRIRAFDVEALVDEIARLIEALEQP